MHDNSPVSFSVVLPNFNHAAYLPQAIESIVSQSYQPAAVYVIDDASTDRSVEIVRSFVQRYPHIHLIQKKKNCGAVANINEFLPQIQGTHALFLGADDYLFPGNFARAHALLSKHPDAGICLADLLLVYFDGQRRSSYGFSAEAAYIAPARVPAAARGRGLVGQGFH